MLKVGIPVAQIKPGAAPQALAEFVVTSVPADGETATEQAQLAAVQVVVDLDENGKPRIGIRLAHSTDCFMLDL